MRGYRHPMFSGRKAEGITLPIDGKEGDLPHRSPPDPAMVQKLHRDHAAGKKTTARTLSPDPLGTFFDFHEQETMRFVQRIASLLATSVPMQEKAFAGLQQWKTLDAAALAEALRELGLADEHPRYSSPIGGHERYLATEFRRALKRAMEKGRP